MMIVIKIWLSTNRFPPLLLTPGIRFEQIAGADALVLGAPVNGRVLFLPEQIEKSGP